MGRPRQPTALIQAKGRKHFTKAEIQKRLEQEPQCQFKDVEAPKHLTPTMQAEFYDIAYKLIDLGVMTELDEDCLASYLVAKHLYLQFTMRLNQALAHPNTADFAYVPEYAKQQDRYFKQCNTAASALGLTISSRCKLVVPETNTDTAPKNKFLKFEKKQGA